MKSSKRRILVLALCITLMFSLLVIVPLFLHNDEPTGPNNNGGTNSTDPTNQTNVPIDRDLPTAISNATEFLKDCYEPYVLLFMDILYRRFEVEEFSFAMARYDQMLADRPEEYSVLHMFRRIGVYDNPIEPGDWLVVSAGLDLITVPALYCDRVELASNYSVVLEDAVNAGGYMLTHALLAWVWIEENGCEFAMPDGFVENLYTANAALINTDTEVTDMELEAASFLFLAGKGDLVDEVFVERAIASQNAEGSWGEFNNRWHTTVLGLLVLLHAQFPADSYPPTLAPALP